MNEFNKGAGFGMEALADSITKIAVAVIIIWAAWTVIGAFQGWYHKTLEGYQIATYGLRSAVMVMVVLWLMAS